MPEKKKQSSVLLRVLAKRVNLKNLILLIIFLAGNSYAWFLYSTQVSSQVDVHVRAWDVDFRDATTPITKYITLEITDAYPGMEEFTKDISIYNNSDVGANITYQILQARIFNTVHNTVEGIPEYAPGTTITESTMTAAGLETYLRDTNTWSLSLTVTQEQISAKTGMSTFHASFRWDYENGDDVQDTMWGNEAYNFKRINPTTPSIVIIAKVTVSQSN